MLPSAVLRVLLRIIYDLRAIGQPEANAFRIFLITLMTIVKILSIFCSRKYVHIASVTGSSDKYGFIAKMD